MALHARVQWSLISSQRITHTTSLKDQPLTLYRLSIWDLYVGHPMHRYTNEHLHINPSIYILQLAKSVTHREGEDMQCVQSHGVWWCPILSTHRLENSKEWTMMCNLILTSCNQNYKYHMHSLHSFRVYLIGINYITYMFIAKMTPG